MTTDLISKFWAQVRKTETCWEWLGYRNPKGYGRTWFGTRRLLVHRLAYELENGAIPRGLQVDHTCRVRHCVNPQHLEAVTNKVNSNRAAAHKAVCSKGHQRAVGAKCGICARAYQKIYRKQNRAAIRAYRRARKALMKNGPLFSEKPVLDHLGEPGDQ